MYVIYNAIIRFIVFGSKFIAKGMLPRMDVQKNRLFLIAAEGILANIVLGTLFVWTVLRAPLLELFPTWTDGMLSIIFGIHNLFTCAGILLGGKLCAKISPRKAFMLFALLVFVGLSGYAFLPVAHPKAAYVMAFILFCCFAATGIGVGISAVQSSTIPWFPKSSGVISGALYMSLGFSSVILAAIAQKLLPVIGVRYVMPVFGAIVLFVSVIVLTDRKSVLPPTTEVSSGPSDEGLDTYKMIRTRAFWLLLAWNLSLRTAGLILLDHAAGIGTAAGGLVLASMLISPANGLGCLSIGFALDKFGIKRVMTADAALMLIAGLLLCLGVYSVSFTPILAGLIFGGFAYGGSSSSYVASLKNTFGAKHYSQNFAFANISMGCAALFESASGTVLDMGGYLPIVAIVAVLAVLALALSLPAGKTELE